MTRHIPPICPLRLFISYSRKDREYRQQLETHLSLLKRQGTLDVWSDQQIEAGQDWERSVLSNLQTADIILLLISPDFLASDYCWDVELQHAKERHLAGQARVIPVFLRPCDYAGAWFADLQGAPDDALPVTTWANRDEAFSSVAKAIRKAAESLRSSRSARFEQAAAAPAPAPAPETPALAPPPAAAAGAERPDFSVLRDAAFAPELVVLPAGRFLMGSAGDDELAFDCERPQHAVEIGYRLAVGRYPVTFEEWDACVGDAGTTHVPNDQGWGRERKPVINVSWEDAQHYLCWLSRKTNQIYRLLSEAEWEYAARAGTATPYWWGAEITPKRANYDAGGLEETTVVGSYGENGFKLCDMIGNVWEWTEDCWNPSFAGAPADGSAWTAGDCSRRVLRGGSWVNDPRNVRCASRGRYVAGKRDGNVGFRVARRC